MLQEWARKLSFGKPTGIDLPGEFGGLVPDAKWRNSEYDEVPRVREEGQGPRGHDRGAVRVRRHRARLERRRQRQPRRRPGRPAGDAAAARHRLRRDRQRRPRRHAAPRPAGRGRRRAPARGDPQAGQAPRRLRPDDARGDPRAACAPRPARAAAPRPTCSRASRTPSTARPAPPSARRTPTSRGTPAYVDDPVKPIVVVVTIEKGGFGAEAAAPAARLILSKWFGVKDDEFHVGIEPQPMSPIAFACQRAARSSRSPSATYVPLRSARRVSTATPIKPASDLPPSLAPREWRLRIDPLLLLAALGLVVCSLIALKGATRSDVAGQPYYYVYRQAVYAGVGHRADVRALADRLHAPAGAALRRLRAADRDAAASCSRSRPRRAAPSAWIELPGLPLPAVRVRQGPARRRAVGLRREPDAARWAARRPRGSSCSG